jgi:hypothetical protein
MAGESLRALMPEGSGTHIYYVDSLNGSDGNAGSLAAPFQSITKAISVLVAGDFVYLRSHQGQVYRPAPGKLVIGAGTSSLTFTEVASPSGPVTRIRLRQSGAGVTVTVYGNDIDIAFAAGQTANQVKTAFDAVGAATALCSCASGGAGAVSAVAWIGADTGAMKDPYATSPNVLIYGVHSHAIYVGGSLGGTPPSTCNPITIETYPVDLANGFSRAIISPRAGMSSPTPKNETGSDGVTAATLLGTNVPGGTGQITLVKASHWPSQGTFTLAGITGLIHYTGRTGDTLTGLHDGGTAISGTVSASGLATHSGRLSDVYCMLHQKGDLTYPDASRVRNVIITGQTGNRGTAMWFGGNGTTDGTTYCEYYGVEAYGNYYQAFSCDNASANNYLINCYSHDNGTGQASSPSNLLTAPDSQQHGSYMEGNNHLILNCVIRDNPWGCGFQQRVAGSGTIVAHCTIVRNGWGTGSTIGDGIILDSITNITIKNCVIYDQWRYSMHENTLLPANAVTEDHNILSQLGALGVNNNYYADNTGTGQSTPFAAWDESGGGVTRLTSDPGFANYASRDLHPVPRSAIDLQSVDTRYSPAEDFDGDTRTRYTAGAFEVAQLDRPDYAAFPKALPGRL